MTMTYLAITGYFTVAAAWYWILFFDKSARKDKGQ